MNTSQLDLKELYGESRYVTRFIFFPKTLNGITKWLEYAHIKQTVTGYVDKFGGNPKYQWEDKAWA